MRCVRRIDNIRQRKRVVNIRGRLRIPLKGAGEAAGQQQLRDDVILVRGDLVEDFSSQRYRIRDVDRDEHLLNRLPNHRAGRLGVVPHVHFCRRRRVAAHFERTAHVNDALDQRNNLGLQADG